MRKILSLFLVVCMIFSLSTVTFATEGGHSTKVKYVGTGSSEWELDVPIQLAPGETGNVMLYGAWDSSIIINVTADESVTLGNDIDDNTKTLDIVFDGISQVGNMDTDIEVVEQISVSDMNGGLFGTWEGIFNYNVIVADTSENITVEQISGNSYINLYDVSSTPHEITCKLTSETITDFSNITVARYNGNLTNAEFLLNDNLISNNDGSYTFTAIDDSGYTNNKTAGIASKIASNTPIVFSADVVESSRDDIAIYARVSFTDDTKEDYLAFSKNKPINTYTFTKDIKHMRYFIVLESKNAAPKNSYITFKDFAMNLGEKQEYNGYEPLQRVTANADGTVNGLTSLSPNMTIVVDTGNVSISCEYLKENVKYNLEGKTIVNFGDSIFGNFKAPDDISTMIANKTNATVYNVGFGGAQMSEFVGNEKYNAFGMESLADAITTGDFSLQEAHYTKEERFIQPFNTLKSINFNDVDIITIAYGTNDFAKSKTLEEVEAAAKYSIETILAKYPNIDIVLCTPIYRYWIDEDGNFVEDSNTKEINGVKLTEYIELYKEIADEYDLVLIDNYNYSGIRANNRTDCFTEPDTVHPNKIGRQMIAENMAKDLYAAFK